MLFVVSMLTDMIAHFRFLSYCILWNVSSVLTAGFVFLPVWVCASWELFVCHKSFGKWLVFKTILGNCWAIVLRASNVLSLTGRFVFYFVRLSQLSANQRRIVLSPLPLLEGVTFIFCGHISWPQNPVQLKICIKNRIELNFILSQST